MKGKKCCKCGEYKNYSNYHKNSKMADGHLNKCKDCSKVDYQESRLKKMEDPDFKEKERLRNKEKYKKLKKKVNTSTTSRAEKFINKAIKIHGDKYCFQNVNYINYTTKVTVICKDHGEFMITPMSVLQGRGCQKCSILKRNKLISIANSKPRDWNFEQPEDYKLIPLSSGALTMVDNEDFDKLKDINWNSSKGYVVNSKLGSIHRFIMNAPKGVLVDHEDGNPLNNRRSNLRLATHQQNCFNSKARIDLKGAHFNRGKYYATIIKDGVKYNLGGYDKAEDAASAYDLKAVKLFGEFARLNYPQLRDEYLRILKLDNG